jgi:hypothetical protein
MLLAAKTGRFWGFAVDPLAEIRFRSLGADNC